jgi:hypothetical protein
VYWFRKKLAWHMLHMALAALLLSIDTRFFLFYAFTLFLQVLYRLDHLRALVRVLSISHDAKLVAIYEHHGISLETIQEVSNRADTTLDDRQRKNLQNDWASVMT